MQATIAPATVREQSRDTAALIWSAFEAAVRASLVELGRRTEDPIRIHPTPVGLAKQAVAYGVIDPGDLDILLRLLHFQNDKAAAIEVGMLQKVIRLTSRTLDELEAELPEAQG